MKKLLILVGLISIIIVIATTQAQIQLVNPIAGGTIELTSQANQTTQTKIVIKNLGPATQGITFTSDLNTVFTPNGFGMDFNQTKTIIASITALEENTKGTISIDKALLAEPEKWNEIRTFFQITGIGLTLIIGFIYYKLWKTANKYLSKTLIEAKP